MLVELIELKMEKHEDREEEREGGGGGGGSSLDPPNPEGETPISDPIAFNNQSEIFRAIEVVERDSLAIAQSFTSLFASLRLALSESTATSLHHMQCLTDATGRLQESGATISYLSTSIQIENRITL